MPKQEFALDPLDCLSTVREHHSQKDLARALGVDVRTIRRWELRQTQPPKYVTHALQRFLPARTAPPSVASFDFIDLFAGIGGIRAPFEEIGGRCVFTSEWDKYSQKTYAANFVSSHPLQGDITSVQASNIPDHDLLLAGFPCQPFSIAGVSKKNALGHAHGFADKTQGTLFFDVARIIAEKKPKAFLLENVKNLQSHDGGRTFKVILDTLRNDLKYDVHYRLIDGAHFVPQHRERMIILGFRQAIAFDWDIATLPDRGNKRLRDVLHKTDGSEPILEWDENRYFDHGSNKVSPKYTLTDHLWRYLQDYAEKHRRKGNGFGFGLVGPDSITRTLSARYYKDGSEILVRQRGKNPRRLTPRECARLMGYDDSFRIPVSDTRAYEQFGNSVVVPVIREVARIMKPFICESVEGQDELPIAPR